MKKIFLITTILLLFLYSPAWGADKYHWVNSGLETGENDGSSAANAWRSVANINWDCATGICDELDSDDVYVYFKKGETYGRMAVLSSANTYNTAGVYVPSGTNRLYLTVDPVDTGAKPIFTYYHGYLVWGWVIVWEDAGYITVDNFNIVNDGNDLNKAAGIASGKDTSGNYDKGNIHVTNCDFDGWGHYALILWGAGDRCVVTGNTITDCGNGIYFGNESTQSGNYHYVANNTATNINGYFNGTVTNDGHFVGFQSTGYTITENNIGTNLSAAFITWSKLSFHNRHNIFRNNKVKVGIMSPYVIAHSRDAAGNALSYGNMIYGNIADDAPSWDGENKRAAILISGVNNAKGNRAFNNTIYDGERKGLQARYEADYTYWRNNLVWVDARDAVNSELFSSEPYNMGSHHYIDYNLYWTTPGDPSSYSLWRNYTDTTYSWSTWKSTAGYDNNSPTPANPLMTDPANQDYTLQSTSTAIDAGGYLTNVAETTGTDTVIDVADSYWFHGHMGVTDADGNVVEGMLITFYDTTNGLQNREITVVDYVNDRITVADTSFIYDSGNLTNPANTTQIALRFSGTKPDIGAKEFYNRKIIIN